MWGRFFYAVIIYLFFSVNVFALNDVIECPNVNFIKQNPVLIDQAILDSPGIYVASSSPTIQYEKKWWRLEVSPVFAHSLRDALIVAQDNVDHVRLRNYKYAVRINDQYACFYVGKDPIVLVRILASV